MNTEDFIERLDRIGDIDAVDTYGKEPVSESDIYFYMPGVDPHKVNRSEVNHRELTEDVTDVWLLLGKVSEKKYSEDEVERRMEEALDDVKPPDGDEDSYWVKVTDTSNTIVGSIANAMPTSGPFSHQFKGINVLIQELTHWSDDEYLRFVREANEAFFDEFYSQ